MVLAELIDGLGLSLVQGDPGRVIKDVTDDSRRVTDGSLFIARGGAKEDGGKYVADAVRRGAAAVVCDFAGVPADEAVGFSDFERKSGGRRAGAKRAGGTVALVVAPVVDNRLVGVIAERFFGEPSKKLKLIGVTGTKGKTTTAFLIQHLLNRAGVKCGLIGTVMIDDGATRTSAELTTPGAVDMSRCLAAMVKNGCKAAAAELSSHALHQGRASALRVDVAVFTNLTGDHLDYHKTMDEYAAAKAVLFERLNEGACAVVNAEDEYAERMARGCRARVVRCGLTGVGRAGGQDALATVQRMTPTATAARFEGPWGAVEAEMPVIGLHNVMNTLEAVAAADAVTDIRGTLRESLQTLPQPPGRLERVPIKAGSKPKSPTVLVDYAHTHDSLEKALEAVRPLVPRGGRLIALFGCGGDRDRTKRPKMAAVACKLADVVVITSDNPRTERPEAIIEEVLTGVPQSEIKVVVIPDRGAAIEEAVGMARAEDVVLLAGKGHEDYQIIGTVKQPFDDRVHAAEALQKWAG